MGWERVALVASGPSLTIDDIERLRGKCRVIVINDNYRLAPWADIIYACDSTWWDFHKGCPEFSGEKWTQAYSPALSSRESAEAVAQMETIARYGLNYVYGAHCPGISLDPALIHYGHNSGFQALNLAVHLGAKRVILLGYDMKKSNDGKSHWFGDHPPEIHRCSPYNKFAEAFNSAVPDLIAAGVKVINCSRDTALTCFERAKIEDIL